jgi:UDP-N-acetylglucosamine 1-carboxyvinyltransferase
LLRVFLYMKMLIKGGQRLEGSLSILGAKNAIAPLVPATLLVKGRVHFQNVPRLTDLENLLEIMRDIGAKVEWVGEHDLCLDTQDVDPTKLDPKKMKRMRFSILLLAPMLARFKRIVVPEPGGCNLGNRPIEAHLQALTAMGAVIERDEQGVMYMDAPALVGGYVILPEFSVTATENLIMAAVVAKGKTSIRMAAAEPHVQDLCHFLVACGAKIEGIGTHDLEITGVKELIAPKKPWRVVPDMLEVGTFAIAAALTKGEVELKGVVPQHLDAIQNALVRAGVRYELTKDSLFIYRTPRFEAFKLQTMIYPGFPTDLQALFGLLATQAHGTSFIHDPLFEARMGYVHELVKMGANAVIADPHRVFITGPTPLRGTEIRSLDIRAGATVVLSGLIADGETIIHDAEMVYRGYERLDERLISLGADITCLHE